MQGILLYLVKLKITAGSYRFEKSVWKQSDKNLN